MGARGAGPVTNDDTTQAIYVHGDWFGVQNDDGTFIDEPATDQCDRCGGHAICRVDRPRASSEVYVCSDFVMDGQTYKGCGATYYPHTKRVGDVVMPL